MPVAIRCRWDRWRWWLGASVLAGALLGAGWAWWSGGRLATTRVAGFEPAELGTSPSAPVLRVLERMAGEELTILLATREEPNAARPRGWLGPSPTATVLALPEAVNQSVAVRVQSPETEWSVELANACAAGMVRRWTEQQQEETAQRRRQWDARLAELNGELERVSAELLALQESVPGLRFDQAPAEMLRSQAELELRIRRERQQLEERDKRIKRLLEQVQQLAPPLVAAREALGQALTRFTEAHPKVKELRAVLQAMEGRIRAEGLPKESDVMAWGNSAAITLHAEVTALQEAQGGQLARVAEFEEQHRRVRGAFEELPARHAQFVQIQARYEALRGEQSELIRRQQELLAAASAGALRIAEAASLETMERSPSFSRLTRLALVGGMLGCVLALGLLMLVELGDGPIRTAADLERATRLPVLGTLEDLEGMDADTRRLWGLRTLTLIRGRTTTGRGESLVCGVASLGEGEGRSTVIQLLSEAAVQLGYRVLAVAPAGATTRGRVRTAESGPGSPAVAVPAEMVSGETDAEEQLAGCEIVRSRHELAAFDQRTKWEELLRKWAAAERTAVFVEVPALTGSEGFLLADLVPHLLWVGRRDMTRKSGARMQLDLWRQLPIHWVGAVFNAAVSGAVRVQTPRRRRGGVWLVAAMVTLAALVAGGTLEAAETTNGPAAAEVAVPLETGPGSFGVVGPEQLADWQKHLTLGPGDTFNIQLYEQADTAKTGLFIGPDGRLNYLEAQDVMAAGLTIDGLRSRLEVVLAQYRLSPRVVINPVVYASKKYYLLGNVRQKGVFFLDRPVTVIEAIARAGGFVTIEQYRNSLTQAELSRSFLVRRQADGSFGRVAVDFEGLFQRGELEQNIPLAPDDYLYFPPLDLQEVYVLGEVMQPGVLPYTKEMTALGAIVAKGGWAPRAYKSKVLIVRGSLNRPQTFIVDVPDILAARAPDFPLENRDIVFVHRRPFAKLEELVELAIFTFARAFVTEWAGAHVGPFITEPIVD